MKVGDWKVLKGPDGNPKFLVTRIGSPENKHVAQFRVQEVVSWEKEDDPDAFGLEDYLRAAIKWDGCSHFNFGEPKEEADPFDPYCGTDGYLHLCGNECYRAHMALIRALYRLAEAAMEDDRLDCGPWGKEYEFEVDGKG